MQCPYCGNLVEAAARKCSECGAGLAEARAERSRKNQEARSQLQQQFGGVKPPMQRIQEKLGIQGLYSVIVLVVIVVLGLVALAITGGGRSGQPF